MVDQSRHFSEMLREREISLEWVRRVIDNPDRTEIPGDGPRHFLKQIAEHGNRWLRVVVNEAAQPPLAITAFFDRRLGREK